MAQSYKRLSPPSSSGNHYHRHYRGVGITVDGPQYRGSTPHSNSVPCSGLKDLSSDLPKRMGRGTSRTSPINHQVDELQNSLHEADMAMTENEQMLSDYRIANARQSKEIDQLRSELTLSREILASSRCPTPRLHSNCGHSHSSCNCTQYDNCDKECKHKRQLSEELEKEKLSRQRAEISSTRMMNLLDTSLRHNTPTPSASGQVTQEKMSDDIKGLKQDLSESHKKLEASSEIYEHRLKEIEEKLKESSQLSKTEEAFEELIQQVSQLKDDLWQKDASEKRRKMLQQIKVLENDLFAERQRHSTSARQSRKLHTQVKQLGQELGEVKQQKEQALTCLEATSRQLDRSLDGKDELLQRIELLQQALASSENQRIECVEKCGQLSQDCFKQEVCQEALRERLKDIESKMEQYKTERLSLEDHQEVLARELSERTLSECRLRDHYEVLQRELAELETMFDRREGDLQGLAMKLESVEKECSEGKLERVQLAADFKNIKDQKTSLSKEVQRLKEDLQDCRKESKRLKAELNGTIDQLTQSEEERTHLSINIEEEKKKHEQCSSQKKELQKHISELKLKLEESEKKQVSSYTQALQAIKKLKSRNKQLEQERMCMQDERDSVLVQNQELQRQIGECQTALKNDQCRFSQLEQEKLEIMAKLKNEEKECEKLRDKNEEVHNKVIDLEATCTETRSDLEKKQFALAQCESDNEELKQELTALKQNLEQTQMNEKRLTAELNHTKELNQSQMTQIGNELEACRTEKIKLIAKYKKLLNLHQVTKGELESQKMEYDCAHKEKCILEKRLQELQHSFMMKEKELTEKADSWKLSHDQELKRLKKRYTEVTTALQETIASLEIKLADEQTSLSQVRKQYLQLLDDQQKKYADDLSKSLEDTERVRRKYLKAKKTYEEKSSSLENEISECSGENQSLKQKLTESQVNLLQQIEEHESILRAAAMEVDTIVHQMGLRVHIPMFPTVVGDETDIKKWMADMLAKLKWLQKEVTDLLAEENKLRSKTRHDADLSLHSSP